MFRLLVPPPSDALDRCSVEQPRQRPLHADAHGGCGSKSSIVAPRELVIQVTLSKLWINAKRPRTCEGEIIVHCVDAPLYYALCSIQGWLLFPPLFLFPARQLHAARRLYRNRSLSSHRCWYTGRFTAFSTCSTHPWSSSQDRVLPQTRNPGLRSVPNSKFSTLWTPLLPFPHHQKGMRCTTCARTSSVR